MKYLLVPGDSLQSAINDDSAHWAETTDVALDGYFYDHICDPTGAILGVRYWVDQSVVFERHPVFKHFLQDTRFKFNQDNYYVDIVFTVGSVDALDGGLLEVRTVQDFGGDGVVKRGNSLGVSFCL